MRAFLDDAALLHHDQAIHRGDSREAMRDGDHALALHERVERTLDRRLDLRIERARRLVQNEDRRVLEDHAGDGDALALAARQLHPALADLRVEARAPVRVAQVVDEAVRLGEADRTGDVLLARIGAAVEDVVAHGAMKK